MELIIGGAYQGKLDYAKEKYSLSEQDIFECSEDTNIDTSKKCIYHFEKYLMYCCKNGISPLLELGDSIVIADDIFCGVVPIDADIRAWREFCGRSLAALTRKAEHVTRIFCGLPQVLK